jgi:predicted benzoate:H+ symporter BenE
MYLLPCLYDRKLTLVHLCITWLLAGLAMFASLGNGARSSLEMDQARDNSHAQRSAWVICQMTHF